MWYVRYGFRHNPRYSSKPAEVTAPNGLNFSRSVGVPTSRLERVRDYLTVNGSRTKRDILRDVFGLDGLTNSEVSGYHAYVFGYGVKQGFFSKERKGRTVLWSVK